VWDGDIIPYPPLAQVACSGLELLDSLGDVMSGQHGAQHPWGAPCGGQEAAARARDVGALHVVVDAVLGVVGELLDLLCPRISPVAGALDIGQVQQKTIHVHHLILDELHVATDAMQ
jgi:hypothetical protein